MPLFFFHLRIDEHLDEDTVGVDLPDLDAVRLEAFGGIVDMLRDAALSGQAVQGEAFEIAGQEGQPVLTVRFDALLGRTWAG